MTNKHRKKASEISRESNYVFANKVPFEKVFPQIEDLNIVIEESQYGSKKQVRQYRKDNIEPFCDCTNDLCYGGGISISEILHNMTQGKETYLEGAEICIGNEGSPKGKRIYRKCMHLFKFKAELKYKSTI